VAYLIDSLVLMPITVILAVAFALAEVHLPLRSIGSGQMDGPFMMANSIVAWIYFAGFESSERGATPGKRALGLRVVTGDGQRLSPRRAVWRHFAKSLSFLLVGIGLFMAGWTPRKRALHDILAGTVVVKVR